MVKVLFFGRLGDFSENIELKVNFTEIEATPKKIRSLLSEDNVNLGKQLAADQVLVSVNKVIVGWDYPINDGDELAFLPPVTGG